RPARATTGRPRGPGRREARAAPRPATPTAAPDTRAPPAPRRAAPRAAPIDAASCGRGARMDERHRAAPSAAQHRDKRRWRDQLRARLAPSARIPVPGGKRRRLVEEEELGVAARLQERAAPPAAELEPARDPAPAVVAPANRAPLVVQTAAVAVDETPPGRRHELAERRHPVLQRHRRHLSRAGQRGLRRLRTRYRPREWRGSRRSTTSTRSPSSSWAAG